MLRKFRLHIIVVAVALAVMTTSRLAAADPSPDQSAAEEPPATTPPSAAADDSAHGDNGYDDEPPLDWPERQWRWYTRQVRPQRFAGRDRDIRYGCNPPFPPYGLVRRDYFGYGYSPWDYDTDSADAYIQGRYDERRFQEWQDSHDKGRDAYTTAMSEGLARFKETQYAEAVGAFVRAAELNQGDPAARLHAAYALVAIGNYDDAVLMIRRAIQLQSRLLYLPLSIREEYGPQVDFDAHLRRLREAAEAATDDPGLWMLLGYYQYFSSDRTAATVALATAQKLAPQDPLINDFVRAARLLTPTSDRTKRPAGN